MTPHTHPIHPHALSGLIAAALMALSLNAAAQQPAAGQLAPVTISAQANRDPVEKSYRKMVRGMDLFERQRSLSPQGVLRFKLLPRKRDTNLNNIDLVVLSERVELPVPIAADQTFTLPRHRFGTLPCPCPGRRRSSFPAKAPARTWRPPSDRPRC